MKKKIFESFCFFAVFLICPFFYGCDAYVTNKPSIPLGTYYCASTGQTIVVDKTFLTVTGASSEDVEQKFSYSYGNGLLRLRMREYRDEKGLHTQSEEQDIITSKYNEILSLAIPQSHEAIQDIVDYGIDERGRDFTLYGEAVNKILDEKIKNYLDLLKKAHLDMIRQKYQNLSYFDYTFDDDKNLTLSHQFTYDFKDPLAFFESDSGDDCLNDFANNLPFIISVDGEKYIGAPSISKKKFSARMVGYVDLNDFELDSQDIVDYCQLWIADRIFENEDDVFDEAENFLDGKAPGIPVAKMVVNTALPSETLSGKIEAAEGSGLRISQISCASPAISDGTLLLSNVKSILESNGKLLVRE